MRAPSARLSRRVQRYVERQKGTVYAPIPHPAFAHIPYRHGPERFDLIAPHLGFENGTVLDIGSRFGYMAHRLEDLGYRVTAVEQSRRYVYFMTEFRDLSERRFDIIHDSVFNLVQPNFDIVFALNIFHHFMKTREALEQLDDFLRRLKCRMMIYQAHHQSDIIMAGAYRNMTPEEATGFLSERLSLPRIEEIGTYKRRKIFKLCEYDLRRQPRHTLYCRAVLRLWPALPYGQAMQDGFFASVPVFDSFERIVDPAFYRPLPDDWFIGFTDVVASGQAVAAGAYKAVNMAGAAAIAAVSNALGGRLFPFTFGGDGATLAVDKGDEPLTRAALAATARWAKDELGLELRTALVPVGEVRNAGLDVAVARYAPSPDVTYAMFSGGGAGWVERQVKAGRYALEPAPQGVYPDLTGLSCRFGETPTRRGLIASVIVLPLDGPDPVEYRNLLLDVLALLADSKRAGHPLPAGGPPLGWPPAGLGMELAARAGLGRPRLLERVFLSAYTLLAWLLFRFNLKIGGFDASRYRRELVANADFRKFDDGLKLTADCTPDLADELEAMLAQAQDRGIVRFGLHRQASALVTCIAPAPTACDHIHFVDGAGGGYTAASRALKGLQL